MSQKNPFRSKPLQEQDSKPKPRQQTRTKRQLKTSTKAKLTATYGSHMTNQLHSSEIDFGFRTRVLLRTEGRSDPPLDLGRAPQPRVLQVIGMKPHTLQT